MTITIEKEAFASKQPDRGFTVKAHYLSEPKGEALVEIYRDDQPYRRVSSTGHGQHGYFGTARNVAASRNDGRGRLGTAGAVGGMLRRKLETAMTHRTYGLTRDCKGCRYWSEMIAMADGGGPIKAMCLSPDGPQNGRYMTGGQTCPDWKSGHYGVIDNPPNYGAEVRPLYEAEDRGAKARGAKK